MQPRTLLSFTLTLQGLCASNLHGIGPIDLHSSQVHSQNSFHDGLKYSLALLPSSLAECFRRVDSDISNSSALSLGYITVPTPGPIHRQEQTQNMTPNVDRSAIPGTVTLVDLEHTIESRHLDRGDRDIILIPTPSNDPDDPLNWSRRRKLLSTVCVSG